LREPLLDASLCASRFSMRATLLFEAGKVPCHSTRVRDSEDSARWDFVSAALDATGLTLAVIGRRT
jgi:Na+-transporting NADH:ubiquinone oxidoreductase subunit NqrB